MQKEEFTSFEEGDKIASAYDDKQQGTSLHDDADLAASAPHSEGLQRNLQARHLTMISLGKDSPFSICFIPRPRPNLNLAVFARVVVEKKARSPLSFFFGVKASLILITARPVPNSACFFG